MSQVSRRSEVAYINGTLSTPAIFWHICGNFRMSRDALQKLERRSRYKKRTKLEFCTSSKKGVWKSILAFRTKISLIFFISGSCPPLSTVRVGLNRNGLPTSRFQDKWQIWDGKRKTFFSPSRIITFLPVQKSFVPAGPKSDVFRKGCDMKRHQLKKNCVRERHILPRNLTDVSRCIFGHRKKWQMWRHLTKSETGSWEEIRLILTLPWTGYVLPMYGSRSWVTNDHGTVRVWGIRVWLGGRSQCNCEYRTELKTRSARNTHRKTNLFNLRVFIEE